MGKQEIKQKETQVSTNGGIGKQLEQTFTVDDNCLPSQVNYRLIRILTLE